MWVRATFALLAFASATWAQDASWATVRITSHGCSGCVVATSQGLSWVLTCAHGFEGQDRHKRIAIDAPAPRVAATRTGGITVYRVDYRLDLCLLRVGYGPLPYMCPIAPVGHRARRMWSCGFDEMKSAMTVKSATPYALRGAPWYQLLTNEAPWHGRSGGPLIDPDEKVVIGTVIGYQSRPSEARLGYGPGVYTSHAALIRFMQSTAQPNVTERRSPDCLPGGS